MGGGVYAAAAAVELPCLVKTCHGPWKQVMAEHRRPHHTCTDQWRMCPVTGGWYANTNARGLTDAQAVTACFLCPQLCTTSLPTWLSSPTSLLVGCTFTSTCLGGSRRSRNTNGLEACRHARVQT
jgi:hypothetical protein